MAAIRADVGFSYHYADIGTLRYHVQLAQDELTEID